MAQQQASPQGPIVTPTQQGTHPTPSGWTNTGANPPPSSGTVYTYKGGYNWSDIAAGIAAMGNDVYLIQAINSILMLNGRKRAWHELSLQEQNQIAGMVGLDANRGLPAPNVPEPEPPAGSPSPTPGAEPSTPEEEEESAFDEDTYKYLVATFTAYGLGSLAPKIMEYVQQGYSGATIAMLLRQTPEYAARFPGMQALASRGQVMSEEEYISQERAYRAVMTSYGLPSGFYDGPEDFGKLIANGVSPREVDERVGTAQRILNSSDPYYRDALQNYYGISGGTALAYMLDADRAQDAIRRDMRAVAIGGAAGRYGFNLDRGEAEGYAGTALGMAVDSLSAEAFYTFEERMKAAAELDRADSQLAAIDNEAYQAEDSIDVVFGDEEKQFKSKQRGSRERGRFSGGSAITRTSLTQRQAY